MVWIRCHGISCLYFLFYFRLRTLLRQFFESAILKVTWLQPCLKFVLNNCEARWQQHFERNLAVKDFTDMDQHKCYFFRLNIMNQKLPTVHEKLSVTKKSELVLRKKLLQNTRCHFTYFNTLPFLSPTNLVFKINPVITEKFSPQFI